MKIAKILSLVGTEKFPVSIKGMIVSFQKINLTNGLEMAIVSLQDDSGIIECCVFPQCFDEYKELLKIDNKIIVEGTTHLHENPRKIYPEKISQ